MEKQCVTKSCRDLTLAIVTAAYLVIAAMSAQPGWAQTQSSNQTASFTTSGSVWGTGAGRQSVHWGLNIPDTPYSNQLRYGFFPGVTGVFSLSNVYAGVDFDASLDLGTINIDYPINIQFMYPSASTWNRSSGQPFTLTSSWNAESGASFTTTNPQASATLSGGLFGSAEADIDAPGGPYAIWSYDFSNSPANVTLFDINSSNQSGSFTINSPDDTKLIWGSYHIDPNLGTTSTQAGNQLSSSASDSSMFVVHGDITNALYFALQAIDPTLPALPIGYNEYSGDVFGVFSYDITTHLLDAQLALGAGLTQRLTFTAIPQVTLNFSSPVNVTENGTTFPNQTSFNYSLGPKGNTLQIYPTNSGTLTITPTISLPATLSNANTAGNSLTNTTSLYIGVPSTDQYLFSLDPLELSGDVSTPIASWSDDVYLIAPFGYTPSPFQYQLFGSSFPVAGFQSQQLQSLTIVPSSPPTANPQTVSVPFNKPASFTLTGTDPNSPPEVLTFSVASQPTHGTLSGSAPNLTYTPNQGFDGTDSFTFTAKNTSGLASSPATVTLNVQAGTPTANTQTVNVPFNKATAVTLSGTDPNSPPESLLYFVGAQPSHGSLSGSAPNLIYTPSQGFSGTDGFTFTVRNTSGLTSQQATVTLNVAGAGAPTANSQSVSVAFNASVPIILAGSDPNSPPEALTYSVASQPSHGSLSGAAPDLTYTPNQGFSGADSFTFKVKNTSGLTSSAATVTINIAGAGTPTANPQTVDVPSNTPVSLTLTGADPNSPPEVLTYMVVSQPSDGTLSGIAPNLTYTPGRAFSGTDSFTFTVTNTSGLTSLPASVTLVVSAQEELEAPTDLTAIAGNQKVYLTWEAPLGAISYHIYMGSQPGGENGQPVISDITSTHVIVSGLKNNKTYYFEVTAVNASGESSRSNEASATPSATALPAPTNLTATPGDREILLQWTASAFAKGYNVYEGTSPGGESNTPVALDVTHTSYVVKGLKKKTTYYFYVTAVATYGLSVPSNEAHATTEPPATPIVTILHSFGDGTVPNDGAQPTAPGPAMILASDGNFYGTTQLGGSAGQGTVFRMTPAGLVTVIHSFEDGTVPFDGAQPFGGIMQASDGNLYGVTELGGTTSLSDPTGSGYGTVFRMTLTGAETILHDFEDGSVTNDGGDPTGCVTQASDGNFYGTTLSGGALVGSDPISGNPDGFGTVYKMTPSGIVTILHRFNDGSVANDGQFPYAGLVQATDGRLYGTTRVGGPQPANCGVTYRITTSGQYEVLTDVTLSDGDFQYSGLIQAKNGLFYGGGYNGGSANLGSIFSMTSEGAVNVLHNFADGTVANDGFELVASLVQGIDGSFYGTTWGGVKNSVAFRITPSGGYTILHDFGDGTVQNDGLYPDAAMIQGTDGNFYGTTRFGGAAGQGTIFKMTNPN